MNIKIGKRIIGDNYPTYIILEIARTYNHNLDTAKKMIEIAASVGADAVKIQTIYQDELMLDYELTKKHCQYLRSLEQSRDWHLKLQKIANSYGLDFLSTPEGFKAGNLLESINVPAYKIASLDVTYHEFLRFVAKKKKPMILSTGMASIEEIEEAIRIIKSAGNNQIVLLHCVSLAHPSVDKLNLSFIKTLHDKFHLPVGFSDHSLDLQAPMVAVAMGASIIEKHFTLKRQASPGDHFTSINPDELKVMIANIRSAEKMFGSKNKSLSFDEKELKRVKRRKLVASVDIKTGQFITNHNTACLQIGTARGIDCYFYKSIRGKKLTNPILRNQVITKRDFQ